MESSGDQPQTESIGDKESIKSVDLEPEYKDSFVVDFGSSASPTLRSTDEADHNLNAGEPGISAPIDVVETCEHDDVPRRVIPIRVGAVDPALLKVRHTSPIEMVEKAVDPASLEIREDVEIEICDSDPVFRPDSPMIPILIDSDSSSDSSIEPKYAVFPATLSSPEPLEQPVQSYRAVCPATLRSPESLRRASPISCTMAVDPALLEVRYASPCDMAVDTASLELRYASPIERSYAVCPATLSSPELQEAVVHRFPSPVAHEHYLEPVQEPLKAVCPAALNSPEPLQKLMPASPASYSIASLQRFSASSDDMPSVAVKIRPKKQYIKMKVDPSDLGSGDDSSALSSDEVETRPLVKKIGRDPALNNHSKGNGVETRSVSSSSAERTYFKAVRKAHYTKDLRQIEDLNEKYKDSAIEVNQSSEKSWRPLQLAAAFGDTKVVKLLCEHKMIDIRTKDDDGDTPLHAAAYWDHTEVVSAILDKAKAVDDLRGVINERNKTIETPISYAASRYHKDSCLEMINVVPPLCYTFNIVHPGRNPGMQGVETDHGIFAKLRTHEAVSKFKEKSEHVIKYHQLDGQGNSIINTMITTMPDLVVHILDKSIMATKIAILEDKNFKSKHKDIHRVIVDFGALEKYNGKEPSVSDNPEEETGATLNSGYYRHGSNPLQTMTKISHRHELLTHPVVEALIMTKWEKFARTHFYLFTFLLYLIFFCSLMAYQATQVKPFLLLENGTTVRTWIENTNYRCDAFPDGCYEEKPKECAILGYILLVMSSIRLFLELLDVFDRTFNESHPAISRANKESSILLSMSAWLRGLGNYLKDPENYLEIILYGSSLIFSLNVLDQQAVMSPIQWQIGTLAVLAGFINLLLLSQVFPKIGIYIIMFFKITWTFVTKILALLVFFVILFVVIFHMLLSHTAIFRNISGESIFKTLSAGVSGVEYDDYDQHLTYTTSTLLGLIAFALFVQVLFLNLATALAIEDVKEIRIGAEKAMNALKIQHIYHAERIMNIWQWVVKHVCVGNYSQFMEFQRRFRNMPAKKFNSATIKLVEKSTKLGESWQ